MALATVIQRRVIARCSLSPVIGGGPKERRSSCTSLSVFGIVAVGASVVAVAVGASVVVVPTYAVIGLLLDAWPTRARAALPGTLRLPRFVGPLDFAALLASRTLRRFPGSNVIACRTPRLRNDAIGRCSRRKTNNDGGDERLQGAHLGTAPPVGIGTGGRETSGHLVPHGSYLLL